MGNRVSADDIKEILDTSLSDSSIEAFIQAANITITKWLSTDSGLSSVQLKEIERWLSCHLIACTREKQVRAEEAGDASVTYQGTTGMGLDATFYGQQVKVLDTSGILAAQMGKRQASIFAIESFDEEETSIDDE
jgi:hypothetical protein